jgi:hypothetical protein
MLYLILFYMTIFMEFLSFLKSIRCVLIFSIIIFLQEFFIHSRLYVHVYIQAFSPQMNTSVIHNMVSKSIFRVRVIFSSP